MIKLKENLYSKMMNSSISKLDYWMKNLKLDLSTKELAESSSLFIRDYLSNKFGHKVECSFSYDISSINSYRMNLKLNESFYKLRLTTNNNIITRVEEF